MLSQVELGRPRGEVFPGYIEAALPSSHQKGECCGGQAGAGCSRGLGGWEPRLAGSYLVIRDSVPHHVCAPVCGARRLMRRGSSFKHWGL